MTTDIKETTVTTPAPRPVKPWQVRLDRHYDDVYRQAAHRRARIRLRRGTWNTLLVVAFAVLLAAGYAFGVWMRHG